MAVFYLWVKALHILAVIAFMAWRPTGLIAERSAERV